MLIEQHRMSPQNREIISQLCYDGKLEDGQNIKDRQPKEIEMKLEKWLPSLSSPVIFIKHKHPEKRVTPLKLIYVKFKAIAQIVYNLFGFKFIQMGTSYFNKEEMKI